MLTGQCAMRPPPGATGTGSAVKPPAISSTVTAASSLDSRSVACMRPFSYHGVDRSLGQRRVNQAFLVREKQPGFANTSSATATHHSLSSKQTKSTK